MKKIFRELIRTFPLFLIITLLMVTVSGCRVVGDIFKAGVWVGIIIVVIVIIIIIWFMNLFRK